MHVLYYIDSLGSGGAQRQAVEIARALHVRSGVRVTFGTYHGFDFYAPRLRPLGIPVVQTAKRWRFDPTLPFRLRDWIAELAPDLIHAFLVYPGMWARLATDLLPRGKRPVFVAAERSALVAENSAQGLVQRYLYGRSDAVTVNARPVGELLCERLHLPRERVHYLPNGIDLDTWDAEAAAECPLPLEPGRFHVALVGGLREEKNHPIVLDALDRIPRERRRDWTVWFIGGETGTKRYAAHVKSEIARRGHGDVVRIAPATPRIAAVMSRLSAIVLPSDFEGFPNILLEAMASRLPSVATAVGDVPNMIEEGRTGFVVPPRDPAAFTEALLRLASLSEGERKAMGDRARETVERRFRIEAVAEAHRVLYESLLRSRRSLV